MKPRLAIIGGGVSGVSVALLLQDSFDITIIEREKDLLLKLLKTGNGKANIFNRGIKASHYNNPLFMQEHASVMEQELDDFFAKLGIPLFTDEEGRVYPYSRSAKGLSNLLKKKLHVNVLLNTNVTAISSVGQGFKVNDIPYDFVILATGSSAGLLTYPLDNNNSSLLKGIKAALTPLVPVIKTIEVQENLSLITNIRQDVSMSLYQDGKLLISENGEVLFKEKGLSGIVSFIVSSYYEWAFQNNPKSSYQIKLDLVPEMDTNSLQKTLNIPDDLDNLFSPLFASFLKRNIKGDLLTGIKAMTLTPKPLNNPENAQVMHGGVNLSNINPDFSFKSLPHLFIVGEQLDIDGICGGYNLGFAFYSGIVTSRALTKLIVKS